MKIQIFEGTYNDEATSELNLINNHMLNPLGGYDKVIYMAELRNLTTFIAHGVREGQYTAPGDSENKTKLGTIPDSELIDGVAYKYKIQGRIQKAIEIIGTGPVGTPTTGTSSTGGFFTITLKNKLANVGSNLIFYNGKMARVMIEPSGGPGAWNFYCQCYPGDTFTWATWVAPQLGTKTCFAGFTTYGERSLRGYGNAFYPDIFTNHMTIQRKGISISGDANCNVIWYEFDGQRGWDFEENKQMRAQFLLEDEYNKWFGKSTMKDTFGNLLTTPAMTDLQTGEPIYSGDGLIEQIRGANDMDASGTDGLPTYDDFADMITTIKPKTNTMAGRLYYCVTGTRGMQHASDIIAQVAKDQFNTTLFVNPSDMSAKKNNEYGLDIPIGYNFKTLNIAGQQIVFVEHPMFSDEHKFPRRLSNGYLAQESTYYLLDNTLDSGQKRNIEILARGRKGINRNMIYYYKNGMTGEGKPESSVDAKSTEIMKQNMIIMRNTRSSGIITPPLTA